MPKYNRGGGTAGHLQRPTSLLNSGRLLQPYLNTKQQQVLFSECLPQAWTYLLTSDHLTLILDQLSGLGSDIYKHQKISGHWWVTDCENVTV